MPRKRTQGNLSNGVPFFLLKESWASLKIIRHISVYIYLCTGFKELLKDEKIFSNSNRNGYAVRLSDGTG